MAAELELRVSDLETRVARVERQLNLNPPTDLSEAPPVRTEAMSVARAETLFDELVSSERLVSYSGAFRRLIGPYDVWRNAIHPAEVIKAAVLTRPRDVAGIRIRLDALIVSKGKLRPAGGHFKDAHYTEADWIRTFGTWSLLD